MNFDQFYPIEKKEIIKQKKRNYMEAFGESNDLKKYLDSIGLPEPNSPENIWLILKFKRHFKNTKIKFIYLYSLK